MHPFAVSAMKQPVFGGSFHTEHARFSKLRKSAAPNMDHNYGVNCGKWAIIKEIAP